MRNLAITDRSGVNLLLLLLLSFGLFIDQIRVLSVLACM